MLMRAKTHLDGLAIVVDAVLNNLLDVALDDLERRWEGLLVLCGPRSIKVRVNQSINQSVEFQHRSHQASLPMHLRRRSPTTWACPVPWGACGESAQGRMQHTRAHLKKEPCAKWCVVRVMFKQMESIIAAATTCNLDAQPMRHVDAQRGQLAQDLGRLGPGRRARVVAREMCQKRLHLQRGKAVANAHPLAHAEREVRAGARHLHTWSAAKCTHLLQSHAHPTEAVGVKDVRLRPVLGVAVDGICRESHEAPNRYNIVADLQVP